MGGGPPTMESPKEVKKKKLKKVDDHASKVPLTLSDLVGQGKDEGSWTCEVNDTSSNQTNPVEQPTNEVLYVALLQMVVPVIVQGNVPKIKPSKNVVKNVSKNVVEVSKPSTEVQDVDLENLIQTLDSLHACD